MLQSLSQLLDYLEELTRVTNFGWTYLAGISTTSESTVRRQSPVYYRTHRVRTRSRVTLMTIASIVGQIL
jgi:hypothetical protein